MIDPQVWLKSDNIVVDVLWGNPYDGAIKICTCYGLHAITKAWWWFQENDHFFHLDKFPPCTSVILHDGYLCIDYGSWHNFLYIIPTK